MWLRLGTAIVGFLVFAGCDPPPDDFKFNADGGSGATDTAPAISDPTVTGTDTAMAVPTDTESSGWPFDIDPGAIFDTDADGGIGFNAEGIIEDILQDDVTTCLEAVWCMAGGEQDVFACTEGMSEESIMVTATAASCIFQYCMDSLDDTTGLLVCVMMNCGDEGVTCVTSSLGEMAP